MLCLSIVLLGACKRDEPEESQAPPAPLAISGLILTSGPKNPLVTLTGSGFSTNPAENAVSLNELPCSVNRASSTELKVTIPAKGGSGKLKVTVKGQSGESSQFTYIHTQVTVTTLAGSTAGDGERLIFL